MSRPNRLLCVLMCASPALAGMPQISLDSVARMRLQSISFFVACFLLGGFVFQRMWNGVRKDFPRLPLLRYRSALGVLAVWGLLVLVVLTMISGARELLTPGAWVPDGATYRLREDSPPATPSDDERLENLSFLRDALWLYAERHGGRFPPDAYDPAISPKLWRLPGSELRLIYVAGLERDQAAVPLAYEPGIFDRERFVLLASGAIVKMPWDELRERLAGSSL